MGPTQASILQIHPTRRCNLRCLHCYSASGPEERDRLPVSTLIDAIRDGYSEEYRVASFSGGEPILYRELPTLLKAAKAVGMKTTITSNGMLLDERRLSAIAEYTDVLAISLDGIPESHNRMRDNQQAFETMSSRLDGLRKSGIRFGFIFTLTQCNVNELDWAADFAWRQGASLFQIHPLEEVGRAARMLRGEAPDGIESAYAFLESERIRGVYRDRMQIQLDLIHGGMVRDNRDRFVDDREAGARPLGELVSPLVIEADGRVVPFGYGFPARYTLGNLLDNRLPDLAGKWRQSGYGALQSLCHKTFEQASQPRELPVLNWWDLLGNNASLPA